MYSVVLVMAMTTTVDAPACGRAYSCHGCYGGCYGCYGGCWGGQPVYRGCCGYTYSCYGCYGCYGGTVIYGRTVGVNEIYGNVIVSENPSPAPAHIRVVLPENARLFVDSQPIDSQSVVRNLVTPALERGKDFTYLLSATILRNQKEVKLEKEVKVRAGELTDVSFEFPLEVAQK